MNIGKVVSFTGHRPNEIFGTYELENPKAKLLAKKMIKVIEHLIETEGASHFISGGALGTDQIAFICVNKLKEKHPHIKNIIAIPFRNQDANWKSETDKTRYEKIKKLADDVVFVDEIDYYNKDKSVEVGAFSKKKMQLRNMYMVDQSQILVAVFNGEKSGTKNCVDYAQHKKKKVIVMDPNHEFDIKKEEA
jgi:uncharacterized phage-like protein YoqJ